MSDPAARYARDDERARIESVRPALRGSARMAVAMGLVIPGAIAIVATVSAFATYPGSLVEKALVSALSMAGVGLVFTLPMFLTTAF
jgi:chromate transport protein ChrA